MEDVVKLGGNIELIGFKDLDGGSKVVLKKIVGNYTRKFLDNVQGFEKLLLSLTRKEGLFELQVQAIVNGQTHESRLEDKNFFFALDKVLKSIEKSLMG